MAYIFPVNPFDGQIYPIPAVPGALQYQWSAEQNVWLIYSPLGVQSVSGLAPIQVSNGTDNAVVSIVPATINAAGSMSAADKAKLDNIPDDAGSGTVTSVATGVGLEGGPITESGEINLLPATTSSLGGVKVGDNISIGTDGTLSIPTASFGVTSINLGPGLIGSPSPITSTGTITAALATRLTVGAVRVGNGLNVTQDGTISLGGSLGDVSVAAWATVGVSNTLPYTFTLKEGYNISAIEYQEGGGQPRVRVFFQNPLASVDCGVFTSAKIYSYGGSAVGNQESATINFAFKTLNYVDLALQVTSTTTNTTTGGTISWNNWERVPEFDILIADTAIF